jgi:serine protease inhibitor
MAYRVDRPFVFFIRERFANTILFAGVVRDPRS